MVKKNSNTDKHMAWLFPLAAYNWGHACPARPSWTW